MKIKDLPQHGLRITTPSDPSFDNLLASYLKGRDTPAAVLKPSSVFINNAGRQTVIGLRLTWECVGADGVTITKQIDEATPTLLMDDGALDHQKALRNASLVIRPNTSRLFSISIPSNHFEKENFSQRVDWRSLQQLNDELAQYADITVSLDGAFFDDGSFVGPDRTGYFSRMKAMVDAKYDLLREVEAGLQRGKSADEILAPIEAIANAPGKAMGESPTYSDHYEYYKQIFAKEPLGVRKAFADDQSRKLALTNRVKKVSKPWPQLRKL